MPKMLNVPEVLLSHLLKNLIEGCREGRLPNDAVCEVLNNHTPVHYLRRIVEENDAHWIVELLQGSVYQRKIGLDLTRPIAHMKRVQQEIISLWSREDHPVVLQSLIVALHNLPDLNERYHREIFKYIKNNHTTFIESVSAWFGGSEKILSHFKSRFVESHLSSEGRWLYLCYMMASSDSAGTIEFIQQLPPKTSDPLHEEVKTYVLGRLRSGIN